MSTQTKWLRLFLILVTGVISIVSHAKPAPESVTLYTTFTKISVAPGETIDYATIKADKKAIPGDYVTNIEAKTPKYPPNFPSGSPLRPRCSWVG